MLQALQGKNVGERSDSFELDLVDFKGELDEEFDNDLESLAGEITTNASNLNDEVARERRKTRNFALKYRRI